MRGSAVLKTDASLLVWLRPSKQIRAPLYSIKQKRQRRWIVIKYGIVYILAFAVFGALLALREYLLVSFTCRHRLIRRSLRSIGIPPAPHHQLHHLPADLMDAILPYDSSAVSSHPTHHRLPPVYALDNRLPSFVY